MRNTLEAMSDVTQLPHRPQFSAGLIAAAAALDLMLVVAFTAVGRGSHNREFSLWGWWLTGWPFLAALTATWLICRAWRHPLSILRTGIPVWAGTVVLGLAIRVIATDNSAALPFIIVTTTVLAVSFIGWRLLAILLRSLRGTRSDPVSQSRIE